MAQDAPRLTANAGAAVATPERSLPARPSGLLARVFLCTPLRSP